MLETAKRLWDDAFIRLIAIAVVVLVPVAVYNGWPDDWSSKPLTYEELLVRNNKWADERAAKAAKATQESERDMQRRRERVMEENREKERLANEAIRDFLARESVGNRTR